LLDAQCRAHGLLKRSPIHALLFGRTSRSWRRGPGNGRRLDGNARCRDRPRSFRFGRGRRANSRSCLRGFTARLSTGRRLSVPGNRIGLLSIAHHRALSACLRPAPSLRSCGLGACSGRSWRFGGTDLGRRLTIQRNTTELLVVDLQRLLRLLDLPVLDAILPSENAKEPVDIVAPQVAPPPPALASVEELPNPVRVQPAPPLFNAHLLQDLYVALRPTRCRVVFRHLVSLAGLLSSHSHRPQSFAVLDNIDIPTFRPRQASIRLSPEPVEDCRSVLSIAGRWKQNLFSKKSTKFGVAFHGPISYSQPVTVG